MEISKKKTIRVSLCYLIGNVFNKGIALLTLPIFTRILSTDEFGMVNTYMAWVPIIQLLVGVSLGNSLRVAYIDYKNDTDRYISATLGLSIIIVVLESIIFIPILYFVVSTKIFILCLCCLIQAYMSFILDFVSIKYMMEIKYVKRTIILAFPNFLIICISILFIRTLEQDKYWGRILAGVFITTIIGIFLLIYYSYKGKCFYDKCIWKYAVIYSVPLIAHGLSYSVLNQADRIMITSLRNPSETAIYSVAYNLSLAIQVVTFALEGIWTPWFTKNLSENNYVTINKIYKKYIWFVASLTAIVLLSLPEIMKIMVDKQYWNGIYLTAPIVISSYLIFLYSFSVQVEFIHKKTKWIAINTLIAATINIILNCLLIPVFGANGAAYTTLISYIISFGLHYICSKKVEPKLFAIKEYIIPFSIVCIISRLSTVLLQMFFLRIILITIIILFMFMRLKDKLKIKS